MQRGVTLSSRPILHGTLALTAAGLYARLTGSVYRILLVRLVGELGIGLFQMALPVFNLAATLATLGLPAALATVVAERQARGDWRGIEEARRAANYLVIASTLLTAGVIWSLAGTIAQVVLTDSRTFASLLVLPLAVVVTSFGSVWRGYFHGLQELVPSAVSQVLEQTARIVTVLALASVLLPYGLHMAAAGAMLGIAAGEAAGLLYLYLLGRQRRNQPRAWPIRRLQGVLPVCSPQPQDLARAAATLLRLAVPIMMGGLASSLVGTFDVVVIPRRLQEAGYSWEEATIIYGQLTGMAIPILFLPMVAVYSVATAITPAISTAYTHGDSARLAGHLRLGTRLTMVVAVASTVLFAAAPDTLARLLYGTTDIAPMVSALAVAAPFTYLQYLFSSTLIGLGLTAMELRNYLAGLSVRLALVYLLTGAGSLGPSGPLWAIAAGQATMTILHAVTIRKVTGRFPWP